MAAPRLLRTLKQYMSRTAHGDDYCNLKLAVRSSPGYYTSRRFGERRGASVEYAQKTQPRLFARGSMRGSQIYSP
jgi:hypothetical protein